MSTVLHVVERQQSFAQLTVETLRSSFERGITRPLVWRREQLLRLRMLVIQNEVALLAALRDDLGKNRVEGMLTDLGFVVSECDRALRSLRKWTRPERVVTPLKLWPGHSQILREPLGVVLIVAPWNYPVQLLLAPLVGALAAGNAAVLKPSEVCASTSELLATLIPRYIDPDGVRVVLGGADVTRGLLEERFDHIFYTGNGRVAREVMRAAARHLTPVTLELGGKSPCIVDASAKVEVAARRIAWGKYLNAGQTCVAPDYALVHERLLPGFLEALARAVRHFYGRDPRESLDFGRIVSTRHHERLCRLLVGQDVALGGESDPEIRYLAPTVVTGAADESLVMTEEIFGPILPVRPIAELDEAIHFVQHREKPLALYVFAEDPAIQTRVIEQTSAGGVCVNGTLLQLANPDLPFGGVGSSGMGAYHGRASFDRFSHHKSVYTRATWIDPRLIYPPYGALKARWLRHLM